MSANVDQRSKGQPNQVSNGSGNDVRKEEDPYLQHTPQHPPIRSWSDQATDGAYGAPPMSSTTDSFFQSYYNPNMSYPFMNQGLSTSEGPWSNGAESMFGMGYEYSNFYGGFGMPFNNWEYAGEYWGNSQQVRKDQRGYPSEDAYYPPEMIPADSYGMMNGGPAPPEPQEPIGTVEQGLRGMSLHSPNNSATASASHSVDSHGRKKIVDISQPPVMSSDGFGGGEPSLMMPPPSSSQSVSSNPVMGNTGSQGGQTKKTTSWAAIASQPARPQPQIRPRTIPRAPVNPNKPHNMDIGTWDMRGGPAKAPGLPVVMPPSSQTVPPPRQNWAASSARSRQPPMQPHSTSGPGNTPSNLNSNSNSSNSGNSNNNSASTSGAGGSGNSPNNSAPPSGYSNYSGNSGSRGAVGGASPTTNGESGHPSAAPSGPSHPVLEQLQSSNLYNPKEFNLNPKSARFFIIKSYSEDDIHRSIKYNIWCSTEHGNKRLDQAFREREGKGPVYLIFSVNGSGHFCGIAQMMTPVDYSRSAGVWAQDKWKGQFEVKWVYVKDVPNAQLRHIRLENNENKPVTNSRDTQEVPLEKGKQVLRIMHSYKHLTSIFDDFIHYEKRQEEDQQQPPSHASGGGYRNDRGEHRGDHHRGGDRGDHRGGDRPDHRGGDRVDRGDRGDGGRNRDNRRRQN